MMKKWIAIILCAALALTLSGCLGDGTVDTPEVMADGKAWDDSWTNLGGYLGVEQPEGGLLLLTSNGDLKNMELRYATWIYGKETELADGSCAYECQLYLMTQDCGTADAARDTMALWRGQIGGDLSVTDERSFTAGGAEFTLVFYDCLAQDSHYACGVTALGVYEGAVILADLGKTAGCELDLTAIIEDFVSGFHYA